MATLLLTTRDTPDTGDGTYDCPSLRSWLREDWAILFSHPGDFVRCELEMDRWLAVVQRAFAGRRIRPLALACHPLEAEEGWVTQVSGDASLVLLMPPTAPRGRAPDLKAQALHERLRLLRRRRFVMVIDSALGARRTFTYAGLSAVPSPLELLGWADATRTRHTRGGVMEELAASHPVHLTFPRQHKHRPLGEACRRTAPA